MSREHVTRYRLLFDELQAERKRAGGELTEERESDLVGKLDLVWRQMTVDEQDVFEREPARRLRTAYYLSKRWLQKRVELPRWAWIALSVIIGCTVGAAVQ